MARLLWVRLFAVLVMSMACPSVWAGWTFTSNTPDSNQSITQFGNTAGYGYAPAAGDTAKYKFEQDWLGAWKLRNQHDVTGVAGPMGMIIWSQTLSPPDFDPDAANLNAWALSVPLPPPMPGFKKDYRARLLSTNDDISKLNITVTAQ